MLVLMKIVDQFRIRECFGLKPVSHLTVERAAVLFFRDQSEP